MRRLLFTPTDIAPLIFFRIVFGCLCVAEGLMGILHRELPETINSAVHFPYTFFGWMPFFSMPIMYGIYGSFLVLGVCIALGYKYLWSVTLFAIGFTYAFLRTKEYYLNHGYLFVMLSWLMLLLPAHRRLSWDSYHSPRLRSDTAAQWQVFLLPAMMGLVYFYGGLAKLQPDWLAAKSLLIWLKAKADMPLIGPLLAQPATAYGMAYGGLLLDLFVPFLLLWSKTRKYALAAILFFHFSNTIIFKIGVFPWLSITLSLMFFPPDWPRRLAYRLRPDLRAHGFVAAYVTPSRRQQNLILLALGVFLCYQCLMPFRHHLYEGDVNWTEEGHRFSWRMMLRSKGAWGHLVCRSAAKDSTWAIQPEVFLSARQAQKVRTHPDMLYTFVQFLKTHYQEVEKIEDLEIYAQIRVRLNGKPDAFLIDPEYDLSKARWHIFQHDTWITTSNVEKARAVAPPRTSR